MPNRQIFIDTETTGLSAFAGHRIVELAAVETIDGELTGRQFHSYLNPGRAIDPYAQKVHGLSVEFLADKPLFSDVADAFIKFVQGSECFMHNAPFDTGFINAELAATGYSQPLEQLADITCTVSLAKSRFPGESVSLDSLIQRSARPGMRGKHSALEDAKLLADIYFKLLSKKAGSSSATMHTSTSKAPLPDFLPFAAKHGERYLTIHGAHPTRTYSYRARGFESLPVVETTRHAPKCGLGETWMYIAVPRGAQLGKLTQDEKLYVGAQTQDRMFRGDNLAGDNFHHAEMRKGKGANNLISFLRTGREVDVYRFSGQRLCEVVETTRELHTLRPLSLQPRTGTRHDGWWFEQYALLCEPDIWKWNTSPASRIIQNVMLRSN